MTEEERLQVVEYRIQKANSTLAEIPVNIKHGFWVTAVNRMYYACYYAVSALLIQRGINAQTHAGVRQLFGKEFVLSGKVSIAQGRFYSKLFSNRQSGDYEDFIQITEEQVLHFHPQVILFIDTIKSLIYNET